MTAHATIMTKPAGNRCARQICRNERGAALIIVLVMLLLLTILGTTLLTSSTTDLQIAGNYRNNEEAFYGADAAVEYAQTDGVIYSTIIPGVQNSYSGSRTIGGSTTKFRVEYVGSGPPPFGSGNDETFQSNFYIIEATGKSANNSTVEAESEIARIVPKVNNY